MTRSICEYRIRSCVLLLIGRSGVANGLASTFRLMGGAVATAIYSAILSNRFASELPKKISPLVQSYDIPSADVSELLQAAALNTAAAYESLVESIGASTSLIADVRMAVKLSYVQAFRMVYLVAIAFGVVAIVCAACTKSILKERKTMQRAVRMENEAKQGKLGDA